MYYPKNLFKVYKAVAFSIFTKLCSKTQWILEYFFTLKRNPLTSSHHLPDLSSPSINQLASSIDLPVLNMS